MKDNPLNKFVTSEQRKRMNKIRLKSFFYPFKQKRLNHVSAAVKSKLNEYNINSPLTFDLKYPRENDNSSWACSDSRKWMKIVPIHYNPCYIKAEIYDLIKTGIHEYCHIFYQQKEDLCSGGPLGELIREMLQKSNIDYNTYNDSIEYLTNKFGSIFRFTMSPEERECLKDPEVLEHFRMESFVEGFAGYFVDKQEGIFIEEKKHFETIINVHIQLMKKFNRGYLANAD